MLEDEERPLERSEASTHFSPTSPSRTSTPARSRSQARKTRNQNKISANMITTFTRPSRRHNQQLFVSSDRTLKLLALLPVLLLLLLAAPAPTDANTSQSKAPPSGPIMQDLNLSSSSSSLAPIKPQALALVASPNQSSNRQTAETNPGASAVAAAAASSGPAGPTASASTSDVILIRYANVSAKSLDDHAENGLTVYRLFNEPLSVSVIESKFSHSIQSFDVSSNQLSTLPKDLFCPLSNEVRRLNISHNLLENFDCLGLISQAGQLCLSDLKLLDMSYNLIKHLPATGVATLHNLEVLDLSHNLIESLDELALSSLFKLTKLDLSSNRIQHLPVRIFHKSTSMKSLNLQFNYLETPISQMFISGLVALEELDLSFNNLTQIGAGAFLDKVNLTRVDLRFNRFTYLIQDAIRVSLDPTNIRYFQQSSTQTNPVTTTRHRLHHNGQYASPPVVSHTSSTNNQRAHQTNYRISEPTITTEFLFSMNPFICDCSLDWLRRHQQPNAIKRSVLSSSNSNLNRLGANIELDRPSGQSMQLSSSSSINLAANSFYQNDQPPVISSLPSDSSLSATVTNNISEIISNADVQHQNGNSKYSFSGSHPYHYGRIGDLDLIKCSPLFKRNSQRSHHHHHHHHQQQPHKAPPQMPSSQLHSQASAAPSDGRNHHADFHANTGVQSKQHTYDNAMMIDLLTADSSNFLCRYKSHCFALCHCCEFDACDCEMMCPNGCNCYYDPGWQTNIIDCSSMNHTVVPDRIPMDVTGLYLDGNNIEFLKPSNLIARKSLKALYLNATQLQYIANRTFNGLIELQTLHLNDNLIKTLNGYEFEPLAQLKALYLQSNRLDHINNHTFIYLRSLEVLDLSDNRLTSLSIDLFRSIGHHNIRLKQLSIAHNWWSCQCNSIFQFRHVLKQKFLSNGNNVQIVDKNQLRCYYNSTTVGPLILAPLISGGKQNIPQHQLNEINHCSDAIEERVEIADLNPPLIQPVADYTTAPPVLSDLSDYPYSTQDQILDSNQAPILDQPIYSPPNSTIQSDGSYQNSMSANSPFGINPSIGISSTGQRVDLSLKASMPLTSFILLFILLLGVFIIGASIFVFMRQQKQRYQKKSSAASTTSASSSASSTAISSMNGKSLGRGQVGTHHHHTPHHHHLVHTLHNVGTGNGGAQPHHHHLIMSDGSAGAATVTNVNHHHLHHQQPTSSMTSGTTPVSLHHHSASSQSNIYAALVSPSTANSTTLTSAATGQNNTGNNGNNRNLIQQQQHQNNNLYSNSSSTASHHSSLSHSNYTAPMNQAQPWLIARNHPSIYGASQNAYGLTPTALEGSYAANDASAVGHNHLENQAGYKTSSTGNALYSGSVCHDQRGSVDQSRDWEQRNDWMMPKVKQFVSKLVNKSLALGGYRTGSRDELSAITSDKIYDAFISYDKRDEAFVLQHLSAELEYGQPQYR